MFVVINVVMRLVLKKNNLIVNVYFSLFELKV